MSKHCKPNCGPPLLTPGFSKHTQDVPQVGDTWQCGTCGRRWIVTDHGLLYTNRFAPESWWRPLFWFDLFIPVPVPWRPTAPRPTLGAAVLRLTEQDRDAP